MAICREQSPFSTDDWFIATTPMLAGIPSPVADLTVRFPGSSDLCVDEEPAAHGVLIMG